MVTAAPWALVACTPVRVRLSPESSAWSFERTLMLMAASSLVLAVSATRVGRAEVSDVVKVGVGVAVGIGGRGAVCQRLERRRAGRIVGRLAGHDGHGRAIGGGALHAGQREAVAGILGMVVRENVDADGGVFVGAGGVGDQGR